MRRVALSLLVALSALGTPSTAQTGPQDLLRNHNACLGRYMASCNQNLLTWEQASQMRKASLLRNFNACLRGYTSGCDQNLLTWNQAMQVREASLRRNYSACLSGYTSSCNQSLLTSGTGDSGLGSRVRTGGCWCCWRFPVIPSEPRKAVQFGSNPLGRIEAGGADPWGSVQNAIDKLVESL
jgi:hypothetical protein